MVVGAGYVDGPPAVLSWVSDDLTTWAFDGELAVGILRSDGPWLGTAWECPHLVRVDGHDVLLVGSWKDGITGEVLAAVGELQDGRFESTGWTQVTHGGGHYAATTFLDADNLPCVIFWIRGVADLDAGWAGALSIPYRLSVVDGALHLRPHPNAMDAFRTNGADPDVTFLEVDEIDRFHHHGVEVRSGRDELVVSVGSTHLRIPSVRGTPAETLTVIVDGPVLEVCTGTSIAGAQLPPTATLPGSVANPEGIP
jgi:beta-fructofuranosidase